MVRGGSEELYKSKRKAQSCEKACVAERSKASDSRSDGRESAPSYSTLSKAQSQSALQQFQYQPLPTATAIQDDSYLEIPLKPKANLQFAASNYQQLSQKNKSLLQQQQRLNQAPSSLIQSASSQQIILDQSGVANNSRISLVRNDKQVKMPGGQQQINITEKLREKRSSINNYQKRVVELQLNNHALANKDLNLKVMPQSTKNTRRVGQISLDISEVVVPVVPITVAELSNRFNEIKQEISQLHSLNNNHNFLQQENSIHLLSEEKASSSLRNPERKINAIQSQNISPKMATLTSANNSSNATNLFSSPRSSINQINNTITKSKLMIRKQANPQPPHPQTLRSNKPSQSTEKTEIFLSQNQTISKYNSPKLGLQSKTNQNSSTKKAMQSNANSQSTSQLLRNLSQDHIITKPLRISDYTKNGPLKHPQQLHELHSQRTLLSNVDENRIFESKRDSLRYYSPTQMSMNKAMLSRISSVNELKKTSARKSVNASSTTQTKIQLLNNNNNNINSHNGNVNGGLSTLMTAQIILNKQKKSSQIVKSPARSQSREKNQAAAQIQFSQPEEIEENEYMTNQERLWNAIETGLETKVIEDLLKKPDVNVDAKNVFDDGWTALHYGVHEGMLDVVKLLLETYKAQVDPRSSTNKIPFHLACIRGEESLIRYLLQQNANTTLADRDGCTPLHYLCETENYEMIKLLLPLSGASKDIRNRFGKKPVDLISDKDMKKVLRNFQQVRRNSTVKYGSNNYQENSSNLTTTITVHKLKEDKELQDGINQLFKKIQMQKKEKRLRDESQKQANNRVTIGNSGTSSRAAEANQSQRNILSPTNHQGIKKHTYTQQNNRLTIGSSSQNQTQSKLSQHTAQSTKNSNKPTLSSQNNQMFNNSNQSILNKNTSPVKTINLPSKNQQQQSLNTSQSQRSLHQKAAQKQKTNQKLEVYSKRLTSIKSVAQLLQTKLQSKGEEETPKNPNKLDEQLESGDYQSISIQKNNNNQMQSQSNSTKQLSEGKLEDQASVSQRTGDGSNTVSVVNKNHKLTTFSLNQLNDTNGNESIEKTQDQKIGPWSFIAHQLLGTGSFGEVFLVEKISNGKYFAMKVLTKEKIMGHNLTRYAMTERNVMSVVNHPFIVKLNYAFQTQEKLFLILDYCPGGDLAEYLQLEKRFNEDKVRLYSSEILLALEELHRKDIIFRDLKPDNVVLDAEGHAMLTDFGLSKEGVMKEGMAKSFCGSYAYLAPEMLKKVGHGKAVDWYLLGVIIYEMLCGIPPYYANNKEELFENIKNANLDLPSYLSPVAKDIIIKLLNRNPKKRLGTFLGADEIKKHPFFKGIDWEKLQNRAYKAPEPYLKKRFENFLSMSPALQTNAEVYESLRKQALFQRGNQEEEHHVPGWSFVSPIKEKDNFQNNFSTAPLQNYQTASSNGSTKLYVYDINSIQNKLQNSISTPSTKAFQFQQQLRQKNYQSDFLKQSLQQPSVPSIKVPAINQNNQNSSHANKHMSSSFQLETKQEIKIPSLQSGFSQNNIAKAAGHQIISESKRNQFTISSRSNMYDFRQKSSSYNQLVQRNSNELASSQKKIEMNEGLRGQLLKPLTPIRENDNASIVQVPPSRSVQGPDNGILFLDNGSMILNPQNAKTPPPPLWGEILEEENYDPNEDFYNQEKAEQERQRRLQMAQKRLRHTNKKLKPKLVYVYESDSEEELPNHNDNEPKVKQQQGFDQSTVMQSRGIYRSGSQHQNYNVEGSPRNKLVFQPLQSRQRGLSTDINNAYGAQIQNKDKFLNPNVAKSSNLPFLSQSSKPPLPISISKGSILPASRQIRTGAFQKLPTIVSRLNAGKKE